MTRAAPSRRGKHKKGPSQVFISYAREDARLARRLAGELRAKGFEPWLDVEEIQAGENWARATGRAIESADIIVALISKNFARSPHVQREWEFAIGSRKHAGRVLPVLTPGTPVDAVPWIAKQIQHVKADADWEKTSDRVAKALRHFAGAA